ncbi:MAG: Hsp20 family protein [Bacteriovoracaceae bacterium]|nr:Hsp20 family protein [Bacteriovoracaceae bacterium]
MSSAIRDVEKLNSRQVETVKRRGEREIKTIENAHQNIKAELKKAHTEEIVDLENSQHHQINQAAEKKEKVLAEMRNHLQQTKNLTEKELKSLKKSSEVEKSEIQKKLSHDRERINAEHGLYLEELNDRFSQESRKVDLDGKNRIESIKLEKQQELSEVEAFGQKKINQQSEEFTTRFSNDGRNYQKMKDDQDGQFKKERLSTNYRQQLEMKKLGETHTQHIETKDNSYRKGLKDQDLFFEKKYADQLGRHNTDFKTLEEKNKKVIESIKTGLTSQIASIASKNDDPFYKFEALAPRLKQLEDGVEIQVDVPEHSKQDVHISFNGKEAIITLNRRYHDANKTENGTINKINKVESFTTRLQTAHMLDPKNVKSSFENGVMTYVVKKA